MHIYVMALNPPFQLTLFFRLLIIINNHVDHNNDREIFPCKQTKEFKPPALYIAMLCTIYHVCLYTYVKSFFPVSLARSLISIWQALEALRLL